MIIIVLLGLILNKSVPGPAIIMNPNAITPKTKGAVDLISSLTDTLLENEEISRKRNSRCIEEESGNFQIDYNRPLVQLHNKDLQNATDADNSKSINNGNNIVPLPFPSLLNFPMGGSHGKSANPIEAVVQTLVDRCPWTNSCTTEQMLTFMQSECRETSEEVDKLKEIDINSCDKSVSSQGEDAAAESNVGTSKRDDDVPQVVGKTTTAPGTEEDWISKQLTHLKETRGGLESTSTSEPEERKQRTKTDSCLMDDGRAVPREFARREKVIYFSQSLNFLYLNLNHFKY